MTIERPARAFFGHYHNASTPKSRVSGCIGLNKIVMPGNLVALDIPARGQGYEIVGDWPRHR